MTGHGEYYRAEFPSEYRSRGTGEAIPLQEATTLDFMPAILGSRFSAVLELREGLHRNGEGAGSFLASEEAYRGLAESEVMEGHITEALDAYRKALFYTSDFARSMAQMQEAAALTSEEIARLNIDDRYGELEELLMLAVVTQDIAFNPRQHVNFVREIRLREKRELQLHQLFFFGVSKTFERIEAPRIHDPGVGREYIDLSAAMGNYTMAATVAEELGLYDEAAAYDALADQVPAESPKAKQFLAAARIKYKR